MALYLAFLDYLIEFLYQMLNWAVEINEGKIVSVVKEEERHGKIMGAHVVDYSDAVVFPGLVDM